MLKEIYNRIYTFGWVRIKQKIIENNIKPVRVYTFGWVRVYSYLLASDNVTKVTKCWKAERRRIGCRIEM